jgi:dihydroorotate dehydrogenase
VYALLRPLLFRQEAEVAHERALAALGWLSRRPGLLRLLSAYGQVRDPRLQLRRFGLTFANPVGLAAGLDKNAVAVSAWAALGFGFCEVGSVTALAQPGNPKPRLFRLVEDEAIVNRMGFGSDGAETVAARLRQLEHDGYRPLFPIGINLGKSKVVPLEKAAEDYLASLEQLSALADYLVVNVSSPNTPRLRELQEASRLDELLAALRPGQRAVPMLLKLSPDLSFAQLDAAVALAFKHHLTGLIATNTTTSRAGLSRDPGEEGGLSGRPLAARSLEILKHLRATVGERLPIISVGGIASSDDVYVRLKLGASLVQLYTALVYQGPSLVRRINRGLLQRLERDGAPDLESVIGTEA